MRRPVRALAVVFALAFAAPAAAADYVRLADVLPDDDIAIVGDRVIVGTSPQRRDSTLTAYGLDGTAQPIPLAGDYGFVEEIDATAGALATILIPEGGGRLAFFSGPLLGPLERMPRAIDVAVTGDTVVALRERSFHGRGWLDLRDLGDDSTRRIHVSGRRLSTLMAVGGYAAYTAETASPREAVVVIDLGTGREVYRVRSSLETAGYGLGANGRLWLEVWDRRRSVRIVTAAPWRRRPRTLARLDSYDFAAARGGVAAIHRLGARRGEIVLIGTDGERRALTPAVPTITSLAYDGTTLAFASGDCVFAGPVPAGPPAPLDTTGCELDQ